MEVIETTDPKRVDYIPDSTCPPMDKTDVPVNSYINAKFTDLDSNTASTNSMTVQCNGLNQSGQTIIDNNQLSFIPDADLPQNVNCTATLDNAISDLMGNMVNNYQWMFATSGTNIPGYIFPNLMNLTTSLDITSNLVILDVLTEGNIIAIAWRAALEPGKQSLFITFSDDAGASFSTSPNIAVNTPFLATIADASVQYRNGKLYIAWRLLPEGLEEIFYTATQQQQTSFHSHSRLRQL